MGKRWSATRQFWQGPALAALLLSCPPAIQANSGTSAPDPLSVHARFEQLIQDRIEFYNTAFPKLQFVHLRGGLGWSVDMQFLPLLLGQQPASLDYEHPADLRDELMQVSLQRLEIMLRGSHPSASLFKKGTQGLARRENICIITLDPDVMGTNDLDTTSEMLDLPRATIERMHPARYLDTEDHVAFAVDHEVFHCLDAFYNGPVPRSHQPYARNYALFRNENGADAFAVAMNIHHHGALTRYARNIMNVRALALMNDPDHCTWATIQRVLELNPETVAATPVQNLFKVAGSIRDMHAPSYEQYVAYRVAAHEMQVNLSREETATVTTVKAGGTRGSGSQAITLARQTQFWFNQLFSDEPFSELRNKLRLHW